MTPGAKKQAVRIRARPDLFCFLSESASTLA